MLEFVRNLVENTTVHVVAFCTRSSSLSRESGTDILGSFWPSSRIYVPTSVLACRAKMILLLFLAHPASVCSPPPFERPRFFNFQHRKPKGERGNPTRFEAANLRRQSPRFGKNKRALRIYLVPRSFFCTIFCCYVISLSLQRERIRVIERIPRTVNVVNMRMLCTTRYYRRKSLQCKIEIGEIPF